MEGYCVKCRAKRTNAATRLITMKNGKPATQGVCPVCGTRMFRISKLPGTVHYDFTKDALSSSTRFTSRVDSHDIGLIAFNSGLVDIDSPHAEKSGHRVSTYQAKFEAVGGGPHWAGDGAESCAQRLLADAKTHYPRGDWQKELGFATHYIQDANWFPHVFPFAEGLGGPHTWAELAATFRYDFDWEETVKSAPEPDIPESADIKQLLEEAAHHTFHDRRCNYKTPNGTVVTGYDSGSGLPPWGWQMPEDDIRMSLQEAASLVKWAALWVIG